MSHPAAAGDAPAPPARPACGALDPRVERSRTVILAATLDLLGETGYGDLTIEAVAARAGVGKSTIYRHWSGKADLVEDAIRTLRTMTSPPETGTARARVTFLLEHLARSLADSTWSNCLPAVIDAAERDPEVLAILRRISTERFGQLVDLLAEGRRRNEIAAEADLTLLAECLVGPVMLRRLLLHEPFPPSGVRSLVEHVLGPATA
ncbi:MAG: TetR/AcrR family transcriptional regulator [Actinomycetota bacterium]